MDCIEIVKLIVNSVLAIGSILIALFAYIQSKRANENSKKFAEHSQNISEAQIEMGLCKMIDTAWRDHKLLMSDLRDENDDKAFDKLEDLQKLYIEDILNAYETACIYYYFSSVHKERFKSVFSQEFEEICEDELFKEMIFELNSPYKYIQKIYNEFSNKKEQI